MFCKLVNASASALSCFTAVALTILGNNLRWGPIQAGCKRCVYCWGITRQLTQFKECAVGKAKSLGWVQLPPVRLLSVSLLQCAALP